MHAWTIAKMIQNEIYRVEVTKRKRASCVKEETKKKEKGENGKTQRWRRVRLTRIGNGASKLARKRGSGLGRVGWIGGEGRQGKAQAMGARNAAHVRVAMIALAH